MSDPSEDDTIRIRFASFFTQRDGDGCWLWDGAKNSRGYGSFGVGNRKTKLAHRLAMEFHTGQPIPKGKLVCHHCDVKACVNPAHLYIGTRKTNAQDAVERGQVARGKKNGRARLTEAKVREIRAAWARGGVSLSALARKHDVTHPTISDIVHRRSWTEVLDSDE